MKTKVINSKVTLPTLDTVAVGDVFCFAEVEEHSNARYIKLKHNGKTIIANIHTGTVYDQPNLAAKVIMIDGTFIEGYTP